MGGGVTIIKDGVSYDVPLEVEAKGDKAIAKWLESATAQESRAATKSRKSRIAPGEPEPMSPAPEE